ncbi:MAG: hypothetical protein HOP31_14160 [Ignavibacteria bacterium]|nr:hypothetical protein [Ignavibacteria bacterium]
MNSDSQQVFDIVSGNFELQNQDNISFEELHFILSQRIGELLEKNVEKLIHILYRIDVNQRKTDDIFNNPSKEEIVLLLTDAVIERQIEKVQTRRKYKTNG